MLSFCLNVLCSNEHDLSRNMHCLCAESTKQLRSKKDIELNMGFFITDQQNNQTHHCQTDQTYHCQTHHCQTLPNRPNSQLRSTFITKEPNRPLPDNLVVM